MSNLPIIATFTFRGRVNSVSELPMDAALYDVYAVENLTYVLLPQGWVNTNEIYETTYTREEVIGMLKDLQFEIEKIAQEEKCHDAKWALGLKYSEKVIQQKINAYLDTTKKCIS